MDIVCRPVRCSAPDSLRKAAIRVGINLECRRRRRAGHVAFDAKPLENLTMVDAPGTRRRYASVMRALREQQLFRRANHHQMRRLMDFVMAATLLAMTAPLMLLIALTIRAESAGPIFVRRTCIG